MLSEMPCFDEIYTADLLPRPEGWPSAVASCRCDLNDRTPYDLGAFDVVVAAEVIEHLENPRAVARVVSLALSRRNIALQHAQ